MTEILHQFEGFNLPLEGFNFNLYTGSFYLFKSDNYGIYYYYKNAIINFVRGGEQIYVLCSLMYSETEDLISYRYYPRSS